MFDLEILKKQYGMNHDMNKGWSRSAVLISRLKNAVD
jgi:hypothetical protein